MNELIDIYTQFGIDKSRLKRDYIANPLHRINHSKQMETPFEEDLKYLYIDLNMSTIDLMVYFNIGKTLLYKWLKMFNIRKPLALIRNNVIRTNLKKYGVENISQSPEIKNKVKQTCLEKYGVDSPLSNTEIRNKAKQTCLEKYGVEHYRQSKEYEEKYRATCLEKYGVEHIFMLQPIKDKIKQTFSKKYGGLPCISKESREKAKQTCLERYGVDNPWSNTEIRNKAKQTCLERYGVDNYAHMHILSEYLTILNDKDLLHQFIIDHNVTNGHHLSKLMHISVSCANVYLKRHNLHHLFNYKQSHKEQEIQNYISQYLPVESNRKDLLTNNTEIDIYIPSKHIGIEFNGNYWHGEYHKDKLYHQTKSKIAEENGIFLYHIFEYEWVTKKEQILNQINNLLGLNELKIYARKCVIKEVDNSEKSSFLELNHLQGNDSSSVKLGLYYQDELVSLMTFCKPRFNKNYGWELSRFCSKAGCNVIGGASRLFKAFIKTYNPKSIISYSNVAHTRGLLYETLGFNLLQISEPNYVWCKGETNILSRYQCQKHKLLEQGFEGKSEIDIMYQRGYYRIYDCGNKVWVWKP